MRIFVSPCFECQTFAASHEDRVAASFDSPHPAHRHRNLCHARSARFRRFTEFGSNTLSSAVPRHDARNGSRIGSKLARTVWSAGADRRRGLRSAADLRWTTSGFGAQSSDRIFVGHLRQCSGQRRGPIRVCLRGRLACPFVSSHESEFHGASSRAALSAGMSGHFSDIRPSRCRGRRPGRHRFVFIRRLVPLHRGYDR